MPLKNKTMSLIRIRSGSHYSGFASFLQDIFYRDITGNLASKALELLKIVYSSEDGVPATLWKEQVSKLFSVELVKEEDENSIKAIVEKYLGFSKQDLLASKARLRGKKPYQALLEKHKSGGIILSLDEEKVLNKVSKWYSSVTSYYSILNKLKALGILEKRNNSYRKSERFKRRLQQVIDLANGFEDELK